MFLSQAKPGPKFKVGDIVSVERNCRYGKVTEVSLRPAGGFWVTVHKIDPNTGKLMVCPDHARCESKSPGPCPIHQVGAYEHECSKFTLIDIRFYEREGMIHPDLLEERP